MDDQIDTIGFVGTDGALYCSETCALAHGQLAGFDVDPDDYESLLEAGSLAATSACPACGAEFADPWLDREPN